MFILILHFGDSKLTNLCLESIIRHEKTYQKIIVIDNNSNFILGKKAVQNKKIIIIRNKKNLGFAGGMNIGIRYALSNNASHLLLLNNDTILEENFVPSLVNFLDKGEKRGIVAPVIKFTKNGQVVFDLGGRVNMLFGKTGHHEVEKIIEKKPRLVDYVSGCCMLVKREVFEKIGLLDARFFLYYEDVDFCLRAKKAGFRVYVLPQAVIYHRLSSSIGQNTRKAFYYQTKSALIFAQKHFGWRRILNFMFVLFQSLIIFVKYPRAGKYTFLAIARYLKENDFFSE